MNWLLKKENIEYWFKWLEWVTLTAAISAVFWETKSYLVLPLVLISLLYVWYSAIVGVGVIFWTALGRYNFSKAVIDAISKVVGSLIGVGVFYLLVIVFLGLFNLGT